MFSRNCDGELKSSLFCRHDIRFLFRNQLSSLPGRHPSAANSDAKETTVRTEAPIQMPQGFEESVAEYYRQLSQPPE